MCSNTLTSLRLVFLVAALFSSFPFDFLLLYSDGQSYWRSYMGGNTHLSSFLLLGKLLIFDAPASQQAKWIF